MMATRLKGVPMSILMLKSKVAAAGIAAVVAAAPAAALAASSTVDWQIQMHGSAAYAKANGSAQYQSQPGQRELQVEVQRVRSLAGKTVVFSAAGMTLGKARVSALGKADITRNTELGQKVPSIAHGSRVTVQTTGGKLIVSGRF
jgi:hypothetical protein